MFDSFDGFVDLNATFVGGLVTRNGSAVPTNADALPTWRSYSPTGLFIESGTCTRVDAGNTTGLYSFTLSALAANGYTQGTITVLVSYAVAAVAYGQKHALIVS